MHMWTPRRRARSEDRARRERGMYDVARPYTYRTCSGNLAVGRTVQSTVLYPAHVGRGSDSIRDSRFGIKAERREGAGKRTIKPRAARPRRARAVR
eukprot:7390917-Prymnesium_polylepis.2